ncbi:MAG: DUF3987 domain-containing protein [Pirellulales bacterium]|nr:DUF3987 domain-containing protein [Pirellulales bacterium]
MEEGELQEVLVKAKQYAKRPAGNKVTSSLSAAPQASVWQEFQPLEQQALPRFPIKSLPEPLRDWAKAEAISTQTPVDLAGLLSIATCSACVARRVVVEMHDRPESQD